jgi:hypothetical protein
METTGDVCIDAGMTGTAQRGRKCPRNPALLWVSIEGQRAKFAAIARALGGNPRR